jgi:hypothetical protein
MQISPSAAFKALPLRLHTAMLHAAFMISWQQGDQSPSLVVAVEHASL